MTIPRQAEEAAELAEKLLNQLNGDIPDPADPASPADPGAEPPADPGTPPPTPDPEPPVPSDAGELDELRKYKDRYLHLKGKYDTEVVELADLKKTLLDRALAVAVPPAPDIPPVLNARIEKFRAEYGDAVVEAMREMIRQEAEPLVKGQLEPVHQQVLDVETAQRKVAQDNFFSYLDDKVTGEWRPISTTFQEMASGKAPSDPKIAEFLQQTDPSGLFTYYDLINGYQNKWDADKLAIVFNTYLGQSAPVVPPAVPIVKDPPPGQQALVAPNRQTPHTTPAVGEQRIWTAEMINEFKRNDLQNKYSPDESKNMWDDLLAAMSENRIRG